MLCLWVWIFVFGAGFVVFFLRCFLFVVVRELGGFVCWLLGGV